MSQPRSSNSQEEQSNGTKNPKLTSRCRNSVQLQHRRKGRKRWWKHPSEPRKRNASKLALPFKPARRDPLNTTLYPWTIVRVAHKFQATTVERRHLLNIQNNSRQSSTSRHQRPSQRCQTADRRPAASEADSCQSAKRTAVDPPRASCHLCERLNHFEHATIPVPQIVVLRKSAPPPAQPRTARLIDNVPRFSILVFEDQQAVAVSREVVLAEVRL